MTHDVRTGAWCEVHRDRIAHNLELALELVPEGRDFCAVLKADAYGHGIDQVVPVINDCGVTCVGITSNAEAHAVRKAGFDGVLIRLRAASPVEMEDALTSRVEEQVSSVEAARKLCALKAAGHPVRAHLALNAMGMSRDGLEIATVQGRETCLAILRLLAGNIVGICTHFPCNIPDNLRNTANFFHEQVAWVFSNSTLRRADVLVHAGSSLTLVSEIEIETDMYRCGAILYGVLRPELGFRTTMDLKACVISIGNYPKGATVGYDRAVRLERDRRLACLSIGYANGFRRQAYDGAMVLIGDLAVPVVGKISMNTVVVDITGAENVQLGDEVTVFGGPSHSSASLVNVDRQFGTILADLYCDWGLRNQRIIF